VRDWISAKDDITLGWAVALLILAIVAAASVLSGGAGASAEIVQIWFFVFVALWVLIC